MSEFVPVTLAVSNNCYKITIDSNEDTRGLPENVVDVPPIEYKSDLNVSKRSYDTIMPAQRGIPETKVVIPVPQHYGLITWTGSYLIVS